jgi:hypothetical protein
MYGKQEATTEQTKVDTGFYYLLAQCTVLPRSIAPRFIANLAYRQNSRLSRFH